MACIGLIILSGCGGKQPAIVQPSASSGMEESSTNALGSNSKFFVLPEEGTKGKVVLVYARLQFVVLTFPFNQIPAIDQRLDVYRNGNRIGEVKITGWRNNESAVADITAGEAQKGDEIREK
jgi:hypothetical protein